MRVATASEPGSPDQPNEDGFVVTAHMAAVLDGATVRTDTGCIHGIPWLVETSPGTPAAALAIAQVHGGSLRYLVLGDVTPAIEATNGVRVITDNRVDSTAKAERAAADVLPAGSTQKAEALVRMKHAELAARNVPGGFWIAAADPATVSYSLTGEIPLHIIRRVILLTDGAARAVSPFGLYDWPVLFPAVADEGLGGLIKQVRMAEDADPVASLHPRNKIHDDATVAFITL